MEPPHYSSLAELPTHLATRAQVKQLGLSTRDLPRVATVWSFGKVIPVYDLRQLVSRAESPASSS